MYKKFIKATSLTLAVFLMTLSLGACKKDNSSKKTNTSTKISSTVSKSTAKKSSTSSTKQASSTGKKSSSGSKQSSNSSKSSGGSYNNNASYLGTTTQEEMEEFLDNSPTPPKEVVQVDQNMDLGGRTIKIVYDSSTSPGDPPTEAQLAENPKAAVRYNIIQNAMKKMNFNIDWVQVSNDTILSDYMNATAAGLKFADIIYSSPKRLFPTLPVKQLLVPIDNFIDFENDPLYNSDYFKSGTEFLGRRWGFGVPYALGYATFYNRDIFAKEGLPYLEEVYEQGNWTWDTMVEYARATTHDNNGDGTIDQWGLVLGNIQGATEALMFSNGADFIRYDSAQNTYKFAANDVKAAKALQLISDMINSYKIATPDSSGIKFDKFPVAILMGKYVFDGKSYKKINMNYGVVPLPKGPDVSTTQFVEANGVSAYFIPVNTDPKVSAAVIREAFTYWDPSKPEYLTKTDILYGSTINAVATEEDANWVIKHFDSPHVSFIKSFNTLRSKFSSDIITPIKDMTSTPAAVLQSQAGAMQSYIDSDMQK